MSVALSSPPLCGGGLCEEGSPTLSESSSILLDFLRTPWFCVGVNRSFHSVCSSLCRLGGWPLAARSWELFHVWRRTMLILGGRISGHVVSCSKRAPMRWQGVLRWCAYLGSRIQWWSMRIALHTYVSWMLSGIRIFPVGVCMPYLWRSVWDMPFLGDSGSGQGVRQSAG